ncbi:MAG: DUF4920 domain-containing protein [Bacteroidia bacterium]
MKKILASLYVIAIFASCGSNENNQNKKSKVEAAGMDTVGMEYFGEKINHENTMSLAQLKKEMEGKTEMNVKLLAKVDEVCQKKGCWMNLTDGEGNSIRVTFKDYGFFMPLDAAGRLAIVEGIAKIEETSIEDLKEYAKDAGKTKEEIDAITEPEKELVFEASGVILK